MKKKTKLDKIIAEVEEMFGKSGSSEKRARDWGIPSLDEKLGGMPKGVVEVYGQEGTGKTTLLAYAIKAAQSKNKSACVFIDAEHSLSTTYFTSLGVDCKKLIIREENIMEDLLLQAQKFLNDKETGIVVIDSLPSLIPRKTYDEMTEADDYGKQNVALRARLLSEALPSFFGACKKNNTTLVILNHVRDKVGVMFGSKITTPGGRAIKHLALQRIELKNIGQLKKGTQVIGKKIRITAVKNKLAIPMRPCELNLVFGEGFKDEL